MGCQKSSPNQSQSDPTIKVVLDSAPRTIDSRFALDANSQYLENLIHCSLISFDKEGNVSLKLAKSFDWLSPLKLKITLQTNQTFYDGHQVEAKDVKASYDFFLLENPKEPSPRAGAFKDISSIEVLSRSELLIQLKNPSASFVSNLVVGILPAQMAQGGKIVDFKKLMACGDFQINQWGVNSIELTNRKNQQKLEFKIVKDESTRLAKILKGEVDIVQNSLNREQIEEAAKDNSDLMLLKKPGLNTTYIGFNMRDPILSNQKVRRAIDKAIDRKSIIDFVLKGFATPASTLLTPGDPFRSIVQTSSLDIVASKKLLDEAGFPDPDGEGEKARFHLEYKTTTDTTRVVIAKAIAAQLKKIGIDVKVTSMEWGKFKSDVEKGQVQMWSLSWIGFKDPDIYRYIFATESFPPNGGNRGWYSNKELDDLLEKGRVSTDKTQRKAIYAQVENIVRNDLPYVFLWHEDILALVNKKVSGYELYADGRLEALHQSIKK